MTNGSSLSGRLTSIGHCSFVISRVLPSCISGDQKVCYSSDWLICGAGGLQTLVKGGLPVSGKRVVVAGSGPLLLAVAAYLRKRGANVCLVAEQASMKNLFRFARALLAEPGKILQALDLKIQLLGVPIFAGCWPVAALGKEKLTAVTLRRGRRT